MSKDLHDIVAVTIQTGEVRVLEEGKTRRDVDALVRLMIMRRDIEGEFYAAVPHGMYHNGEEWVGDHREVV